MTFMFGLLIGETPLGVSIRILSIVIVILFALPIEMMIDGIGWKKVNEMGDVKYCPYCGNTEFESSPIKDAYRNDPVGWSIKCNKCKQSCYVEGPFVEKGE